MGFICDFCSDQRSMVYCRSDAACLCLSCDRNVHSANALSKRHSRTLLCERCSSQPAVVRCEEEKISLCQNCDWTGHGTSTSSSTHKRQTINCYSGCPSASELSSIWSFVSGSPVTDSTCEQEMGLMSIAENSKGNCWAPENNTTQGASGTSKVNNTDKSRVWAGPSSVAEHNSTSHNLDQMSGFADAVLPKLCGSGTKGTGFCEDDIYEDFNMDEIDLNLENYDELFGLALTHSEQLLENGGISSLFGIKRMAAADPNCNGAVPAEGSSIGHGNVMQPACSNAASADSMMSAKTEPVLCFAAKQANSGLSFSGVTGDGTASDYQDCGASPMLLMGEPPPWCPPCPESSYTSAGRNDAVLRYKEKKKTRKFEKTVRYASRKARADVRKRVKGRFVKAGEAYDYDPLSRTRSC